MDRLAKIPSLPPTDMARAPVSTALDRVGHRLLNSKHMLQCAIQRGTYADDTHTPAPTHPYSGSPTPILLMNQPLLGRCCSGERSRCGARETAWVRPGSQCRCFAEHPRIRTATENP